MTQTTTEHASSISSEARTQVGSKIVFISARRGGTIPLEDRLPDGTRLVSDYASYDARGRGVQPKIVRNIELGHTNVERLDLGDPDDLAFYHRVKAWLAETPQNPRIAKYGIRMTEGAAAEEARISRMWQIDPEVLGAVIGVQLGVGEDEDRDFLMSLARYELQRPEDLGGPRTEVLDIIDTLGLEMGDEGGEDEVGGAE